MSKASPEHPSPAANGGVPHPLRPVRNPSTGELVRIRGAGALAERPLKLREGIDLTKPIFEQLSRKG